MTTSTRDPLLEERQRTHGSFAQNARISRRIKHIIQQAEDDGVPFTAVQREALDMIALKLSRILSGQASFADHWADIAGYSRLVIEEIDLGPP